MSEIAQSRTGGGGHKNVAGFEMPIFEGRNLIDSILGRVTFVDKDRVFQASPISLDKNVLQV